MYQQSLPLSSDLQPMSEEQLQIDQTPHLQLSDPSFAAQLPQPVGYWEFPGSFENYKTCIACYSMPSQDVIKNMEEMLGFKFRESI